MNWRRRLLYLADYPVEIAVSFCLVVVLTITGWMYLHPCTHEESYACEEQICVWSTPSSRHHAGTCMEWRTEHNTCTRCLERAP